MPQLTLVQTASVGEDVPDVDIPALPTCRRYRLVGEWPLALPHGLVGDYRIANDGARIEPPQAQASGEIQCVVWDADFAASAIDKLQLIPAQEDQPPLTSRRFVGNAAQLDAVTLVGPVVNEARMLQLESQFDVSFSTRSEAARLGLLTLVESQRFLLLEDGRQIDLLDTEGQSVLYLDAANPVAVIPAASTQPAGCSMLYRFATPVTQAVPESHAGVAVQSVTVLEQYTSYFMQQLGDELDEHWWPVHAPVVWGWSIRVGRRVDGEWDILRRKLMRPAVGHEGWALPLWQSNTIAQRKRT